jgi:hypothetical protein
MADGDPSSSDGEHRVLRFRHRRTDARAPVDDLAKYARGGESDDYRHRMIVNAAAFLFVVALIGAGLWLADRMAELRRNQDCALSGRTNCMPIEVNRDRF